MSEEPRLLTAAMLEEAQGKAPAMTKPFIAAAYWTGSGGWWRVWSEAHADRASARRFLDGLPVGWIYRRVYQLGEPA